MRYKVTTPVPGWTGQVGMVAFAHGVAVVEADYDAAAMAYFHAQGYGIEELGADADTSLIVVQGSEVDALRAENERLRTDLAAARAAVARPALSGSKADWKAYAIAMGVPEDEADKATRDDLAARFTKEDAK